MMLNQGYYKVIRNDYKNWTLDSKCFYIKVDGLDYHRDGGNAYKVHVVYFKESTQKYKSVTTSWIMDEEFINECVSPITKEEFYKEKLLAEI